MQLMHQDPSKAIYVAPHDFKLNSSELEETIVTWARNLLALLLFMKRMVSKPAENVTKLIYGLTSDSKEVLWP